MENPFFERPILNSPYEIPQKHWELDEHGQPTQKVINERRRADFITPIPQPKRRKGGTQKDLGLEDGISTAENRYDPNPLINEIRGYVDFWRKLPNSKDWQVTPETEHLLKHWRTHKFSNLRPFFCQVEAVETAIWLVEVAPQSKRYKSVLDKLAAANEGNSDLTRIALKLATGAGKTTVMAMLIAWQTLNAVRRESKNFTRGFLIVAPGLTIKDRLRVLQPNDPDSYYASRELVPTDMLEDIKRAKIVITNYHAFMKRNVMDLSSGGRALLEGRTGPKVDTLETEGQMIQRVMPDLMGMKNILVINDEAHHCYNVKPKPIVDKGDQLKGDDRKEAEENTKKARLWMSGLEAVNRKLGISRVMDLSATPFFLRGSGEAEGTLFPWTMSDFSLMDAIECGIVKLPRVPVAENIPGKDMPMYRDLWPNIRAQMPKAGKKKSGELDPLMLPPQLQTALEALYGNYEKTFDLWQKERISVPPCFIIVCQNTAISKLVYDFISGFERTNDDGTKTPEGGRLPLFQNHDEHLNPLPRPNTLLIDSAQLEAGDALDDEFRNMAADEIERFRREMVERGNIQGAEKISDQDLLREVMNTVGKPGQLGGDIRCVVSVSMLTEGWDANTVTHVLGVRAFGTQLLCEQVIGRALRRQSYDLNEEGLFNVEYADVFGIPFDFNAKPVVAAPQPPRETIQVKAMRPERDRLEITFPRILGYRIELPEERLEAAFTPESTLVLTPELVGPSVTENSGIIGKTEDMTLEHIKDLRPSSVIFHLTHRLIMTKFRDPSEAPKVHLFGQLKRITKEWIENHLVCKGEDIYPGLLKYQVLADIACNRIAAAITAHFIDTRPVKALSDPYTPTGSTIHVRFNTSRTHRWTTNSQRCHINYVILDSKWEAEFCRVAESHPRVQAYVKNHNLGLEIPYRYGSENRVYLPDFILLIDDGHGPDDPLHLIVEIKGYRREDAKEKKSTMDTYWIPGVNYLGTHGRWAFAELTDLYEMESDFNEKIESELYKLIDSFADTTATA